MNLAAKKDGIIAFVMATLLLTVTIFSIIPTNIPTTADIKLPNSQFDNNMLNAAAVIKTQKAADSIKNGIRGIDVSKYNGTINWKKVAQDDVDFAIIRATCGFNEKGKYAFNLDPMFVKNAKEAHAAGLLVGAYHHANFMNEATMKKEAQEFIKMLKQVNITYPVVLDIELNTNRLSRTTLTNLSLQFCDIVTKAGYPIMIYSYQNFFRDHLNASTLAKNYELWVANYIEKPTGIDHVMWQHTSSGRVSGIAGNVDINIAYKNLALKKKVTVNKNVSDSIKTRLADVYGLHLDGLTGIHESILSALQMEINRQFNADILYEGARLSKTSLDLLHSINFTSETKGNITYLLQARLFYLGYYQGALTARFDDNTITALKEYQRTKALSATGTMDWETIYTLLG